MTKDQHFIALENMYLAAPISELYHPSIEISDSEATIEIEVSERFFHSAGGLHGSVYFKMLDDAAFFAANSLEREVFVLTTSFTTYLTRPVSSGTLRSVGRVVNRVPVLGPRRQGHHHGVAGLAPDIGHAQRVESRHSGSLFSAFPGQMHLK